MKSSKESCESEISELRTKWMESDERLSKYPKGRDSRDYLVTALNEIKDNNKKLNQAIELLNNKITNSKVAESKLEVEKSTLDKLKLELDSLKNSEPENAMLPLDSNDLELNIHSEISKIDEYNTNLKLLEDQNNKISSKESEISELNNKLDRYYKYEELTSMNGVIYEEILKQLAKKFSTHDVKYEVESGVYRGNRFIKFNSLFKVKNRFRLYESGSDGQKIVCDLDFLNKLFSVNIGVLVLDEYLKHLDGKNFPKACEILKDMNANTIMISTHDNGLAVYTRRLILHLDDEGRTVINKL
jgi:DNA repair exonuclease SbcCD ATPase subunit